MSSLSQRFGHFWCYRVVVFEDLEVFVALDIDSELDDSEEDEVETLDELEDVLECLE